MRESKVLSISPWMKFVFVRVMPKRLNSVTLSRDLLTNFTLWYCPTFCWYYINIYLILSAFIFCLFFFSFFRSVLLIHCVPFYPLSSCHAFLYSALHKHPCPGRDFFVFFCSLYFNRTRFFVLISLHFAFAYNTKHKHPSHPQDSNPEPQQAIGRRPSP